MGICIGCSVPLVSEYLQIKHADQIDNVFFAASSIYLKNKLKAQIRYASAQANHCLARRIYISLVSIQQQAHNSKSADQIHIGEGCTVSELVFFRCIDRRNSPLPIISSVCD